MIAFEVYLQENGWIVKDGYQQPSSLGKIFNTWEKDGKRIDIGLNEKDKPVTIISHRWLVKIKGKEQWTKINDDQMNRYLREVPPEMVLKKLEQIIESRK